MLSRCIYCKSIWVKWNIPCYNKELYFIHQCVDCDEQFTTLDFVWFGLPKRITNILYYKWVRFFSKRCNKKCEPICDCCKHFKFNGVKRILADGREVEAYNGNGFCNLLKIKKEPEDYCSRFNYELRGKRKNAS